MSSPIGGFYLSAINRHKKRKFEYANQLQVQLDVDCQINETEHTFEEQLITVGKVLELNCGKYLLQIETQLLESGLLKAVCCVSDTCSRYKQEFNLSPNEPISSLVADGKQMKLTIQAKPMCEQ